MREKDILNMLAGKPNIIKLLRTFKDDKSLYFVFEHCQYGTLTGYMEETDGKLDSKLAQFYTAEIVMGLQVIHE